MRTVIVGDVHGCRFELDALLDRVGFTSGDRLVFVGDLVARGPDPLGVLDVVRRTGAIVVRGNHEQKVLDAAAGDTSSKVHRAIARALRPTDWAIVETSPHFVDLPEHGARVVHAGVDPRLPLDAQPLDTLLRIRTVPSGAGRGQTALWGERYVGPPHVVFGHNARPGLQLHPWATGLDTGCVYGGRLTALVLADGQKVPRSPAGRRALLVSVPARHVWYDPTRDAGRPAPR